MSKTPSEWEMNKDKVVVRKFDSDDTIRLRGHGILATAEGGMKKVQVDTGAMQKVSIVCGIKSCPWFSDTINEEEGVTQEIFNRRMGLEFRRIPVDIIDPLFRKVQEENKTAFDKKKLQKN